jgi:hypothetical protein
VTATGPGNGKWAFVGCCQVACVAAVMGVRWLGVALAPSSALHFCRRQGAGLPLARRCSQPAALQTACRTWCPNRRARAKACNSVEGRRAHTPGWQKRF